MKHMRVVGLMVVMLAAARIAGAQVLNEDVGVPLSSAGNYGAPVIYIQDQAQEDQVMSIVSVDAYTNAYPNPPNPFATTFSGDLVLTNGGDAPSDWLADIRFFNPLDPTGTLGLPATETEAFFPADLGPSGFGSFQLMQDYSFVQAYTQLPSGAIGAEGTEPVFGPLGGILSGQEALVTFTAFPGAPAASTPEPGALALLFGVGVVGVGLLVRRRKFRTMWLSSD
jgi:hypothetical protein